MKWADETGDTTQYTWLCAACTTALFNFDPDMGDDVDWHPGTCERCHNHIIIFTPTA